MSQKSWCFKFLAVIQQIDRGVCNFRQPFVSDTVVDMLGETFCIVFFAPQKVIKKAPKRAVIYNQYKQRFCLIFRRFSGVKACVLNEKVVSLYY